MTEETTASKIGKDIADALIPVVHEFAKAYTEKVPVKHLKDNPVSFVVGQIVIPVVRDLTDQSNSFGEKNREEVDDKSTVEDDGSKELEDFSEKEDEDEFA